MRACVRACEGKADQSSLSLDDPEPKRKRTSQKTIAIKTKEQANDEGRPDAVGLFSNEAQKGRCGVL